MEAAALYSKAAGQDFGESGPSDIGWLDWLRWLLLAAVVVGVGAMIGWRRWLRQTDVAEANEGPT